MALIVDEYGDLEGLVTPSDILEALVGDIPGSADADQRVVRREDGTWLIDGMVGLDELKQVLGLSHLTGEDADFHTLGGYMMARLNRVPMIADRVTTDGYQFEVVDMDGRRVDRVLIAPVAAKVAAVIRHLGNDPALVDQLWGSAWFWRRAAAVLATVALALLVAALIAREPPDFAQRPVIAVLQNTGRHPAWAIRLARSAHQIAIDSLDPPRPPSGKAYQLWLAAPGAAPPTARPAAGVGAQNYRRDPGEHPAARRHG